MSKQKNQKQKEEASFKEPQKKRIEFGKRWLEYDEYMYLGYCVVTAIYAPPNHVSNIPVCPAVKALFRLLLYDRLLGESYFTIYFAHACGTECFIKMLNRVGFVDIPRKDYPIAYQYPIFNKKVRYYKMQVPPVYSDRVPVVTCRDKKGRYCKTERGNNEKAQA